MKNAFFLCFWAAMLFVITSCALSGGSRHERKRALVEQSGQAVSVAGGETFESNLPFEKLFDQVANYLKIQGETIESADKNVGQIITALTVSGGWRQTGTRIQITLIKQGETSNLIRVAVTEQKRFKALQTEPWGEGKVNEEKSRNLAQAIKTYLESDSK